jgi:hypothetical protein
MNEETIIEKRPTANGQQETKKEGSAWKHVTLGGVSGILMGAGLLYAGQAVAQNVNNEEKPEETPEEKPEDEVAPEQGETSHTLENGLKVASVSDDLSFGEAFQQARAEVGPGGVFHWHGGIYNTYSADEWNAMSVDQKHDFAEQVQPEIRPDEISTPTDADTHVVVVHHVYHHEDAPTTTEVHQVTEVTETSEDVQIVDPQTAQNFEQGDDVHIVGYASVDGHLAVGYDTTGDGQADVAIIDVDDNRELSDADVIIDDQGNSATVGEVINTPDSNQMAAMENPDVAPDMPDYMNDANIDDMNVLA